MGIMLGPDSPVQEPNHLPEPFTDSESDGTSLTEDAVHEEINDAAGSADPTIVILNQQAQTDVPNPVHEWIERYQTSGLPDISDDLSDIKDTVLEDQDPSAAFSLTETGDITLARVQGSLDETSDSITKASTPQSSEEKDLEQNQMNPMETPEFELGWCDRGFHVDFDRSEKEPLVQLRFLGQGLNGPVYETRCKGVSLAWKKKFKRRGIGAREKREISIMTKLSHHHITKLVGTYTAGKFFGLLIWPVAVCDLATLLDDLDMVKEMLALGNNAQIEDSEVTDRLQALGLRTDNLQELHTGISGRLNRSLGCLTSAVAYFHGQEIKHKDLKPSNILLSRNGGLWITDFECSTDFSFLTSSVTEEGERGTAKYFAPEVAGHGPCSRAADIFSLGCIFLEILWACVPENSQNSLRALRPNEDTLFHCSYHTNLRNRHQWIEGLSKKTLLDRHLTLEVCQMLEIVPEIRPTAKELEGFLFALESLNTASTEPILHSHCCVPAPSDLFSQQRAQETAQLVTRPLPSPSIHPAMPPNFEDQPMAKCSDQWVRLSAHWEEQTSSWIKRLNENDTELRTEPQFEVQARQIYDLSAAGANLFHAVVELQRLRASTERKFQHWFFDMKRNQEENMEQRALLERELQNERRKRLIAQANARTAEEQMGHRTANWHD
ncbi:kinase-like domain-containing protein [Clohesyomyces aquaticus]|uniref:Kinase-like domain-containing protein n=1 Tax=Clohesyomyces aquaticus TaxID=1231657 RepID=A0A1Y2A402_9PLEO|nr:kinase-like domain-containing protein [Clohesyomyces aquaticus]